MPDYIVSFSSGCYRVLNITTLKKYYIITANSLLASAIWRGDNYGDGKKVAREANQKRRLEGKRDKKLRPQTAAMQEKLL